MPGPAQDREEQNRSELNSYSFLRAAFHWEDTSGEAGQQVLWDPGSSGDILPWNPGSMQHLCPGCFHSASPETSRWSLLLSAPTSRSKESPGSQPRAAPRFRPRCGAWCSRSRWGEKARGQNPAGVCSGSWRDTAPRLLVCWNSMRFWEFGGHTSVRKGSS